jgi:hypothetical protein
MTTQVSLLSQDGKSKITFCNFYRPNGVPSDDDRMWEYNVRICSVDLSAESKVMDGYGTNYMLKQLTNFANDSNVPKQLSENNVTGDLQLMVENNVRDEVTIDLSLSKYDFNADWYQWTTSVKIKTSLNALQIFCNELSMFFK